MNTKSFKDDKCNIYTKDAHSVYKTDSRISQFNYSDGRASEKYLLQTIESSKDLSSESHELQSQIKDWPSEYHLSIKRAQLISHFDFPDNARVLEVGCGCGAITRILGEKFNEVISIEGNYQRARIAAARCRDLESVKVVNSRYQDIHFENTFDFVFCIGVLEYAGYLVEGENPYLKAIDSFHRALKPGGILVLAIENQYGLKYIAGLPEDHTNIQYEGIEGYPTFSSKVKTFGRKSLESLLSNHFQYQKYYNPYPDYKVPDAVLSEDFINKAHPWELIGSMQPRDYSSMHLEKFSGRLAVKGLSENCQLPFFSNSFLVFACSEPRLSFLNRQSGFIFSDGRQSHLSTVTYIKYNEKNFKYIPFSLDKELRSNSIQKQQELKAFVWHQQTSEWIDGPSLQECIMRLMLDKSSDADAIRNLLLKWKELIVSLSKESLSVDYINGMLFDATWKNCIVSGSNLVFFDLEWESVNKLRFKDLILRSAFILFNEMTSHAPGRRSLRYSSGYKLSASIAKQLGIKLEYLDIIAWATREHSFMRQVSSTYKANRLMTILIQTHSFGIFELVQLAAHGINRIKIITSRIARLPVLLQRLCRMR